MKPVIVFVALMLCFGVHVIAAPKDSQAVNSKRPKWEYKVVSQVELFAAASGKADPENSGLNALGEDGWELVSIQRLTHESGPSDPPVYYFKRPKG
ncbi:DUF4177 domain-containing protein [Roseimicrobium sp. ORNL1]|uniref:DUF4177 domain-containing protein n=1 Tax=Roseimicrobium sp. ORNL1 TaxID=2711231 RepID=UPI0013E1A441|nr:DUF4177 domain-containing protein [Roseimicrobium sp. ORNL1]QIF02635.1 DUF4177 domain-containing protein [Roseimicrobium sp. ORNL1]